MRISDWSSDVCSSDLPSSSAHGAVGMQAERAVPHHANRASSSLSHLWQGDGQRGVSNADGWWTLKWIHAADTADGFRRYSADQHASAPSPLAGGNSDGTKIGRAHV